MKKERKGRKMNGSEMKKTWVGRGEIREEGGDGERGRESNYVLFVKS